MGVAQFQPPIRADDVKDFAEESGQFFIVADGVGQLGEAFWPCDVLFLRGECVQDDAHPAFHVLAQQHRVAAGGEVAHAGVVDGLEKYGRGRGAIAHLLMQFPQHVADEHRAHVCVAVGDLDDAPGNCAAIVQQFGAAAGRADGCVIHHHTR